MKKSELLQKLKNYIDDTPDDYIDPKEILNIVEQAGMLPPPAPIEFKREFNGTEITWTKEVNQWEDQQ